MNVSFPQLRLAALLGALLLPAGLPANTLAAVRGPTGRGSQPARSARPGPGSSAARYAAAGRNRQLLYQLRGATQAQGKGGG
jgi:hypothetical protein